MCGTWSALVGATLRTVASSMGTSALLGQGAPTFIAGIGEESLKLVPVVAVAVLAPRRVSRFAATDFALLGLASGAAFQGVEEAARRVAFATGSSGQLSILDGVQGGLPLDFVHYRLWPIPTELVNSAAWTGNPVVFAGHAMTTGLVAAVAGLAVVAWRTARSRSVVSRLVIRAGSLVVPVVVLVTMMSDHLACNARGVTGDDWLAPGSAVPWWLQDPWKWFGHAQYRPAMFVAVMLVCLMVDAFRLAARPGTNLVPGPAWGSVARAGARLSAWHARAAWPGKAVANTLNAVLALVWITGRDLAQQTAAHTREPGEKRLAAARRGATTASGQRAARELGMEHHAGTIRLWRARLLAAAVLVGLLVAALVLAPHLAAHTGPTMQGEWHWLAGLLDALSHWWHSLSPLTQVLIGVGIACALALIPGMSFALAFGISGVLTWGLDKSAGLATFIRDPETATRDYFAHTTPLQMLADTANFALTFAPGNFAGAAVGRGARAVTREIAEDPAAWAAGVRQRLREGLSADEGSMRIPPGRRWSSDPEEWEDYADDLADQGATGTQRPVGYGDGGMPGSNVVQNRQARQATAAVQRMLGRALKPGEKEQIHDAISHGNMDFNKIVDELVKKFSPPEESL